MDIPPPDRTVMDMQMQGIVIDGIVFAGILVAVLVLAVFWVPDLPQMVAAIFTK
jgi:hypothetical protein